MKHLGRKPWRQKGTGRARHGTLRGPQFRHGATMNGPKPRSHAIKLQKKVRRLGLKITLSARTAEGKMTVRDALNSALDEEMAADPKVFLMGEEVGEYQGAYKITKGLLDKFGPDRVLDNPITETKLQEVKITQPSSSSSSIASADDIYSQVFGKERPGRVRGVGTGPTPTSLWGTSSQCQAQLRAENAQLNAMVKKLAERLGKVESIVVESKQVESTPNIERCVQSSASVIGPKGKEVELDDT